jgi:hypothetical protein
LKELPNGLEFARISLKEHPNDSAEEEKKSWQTFDWKELPNG